MNRIMKKLVPGVLAAALALGAVPSGITFDDIVAKADEVITEPGDNVIYGVGGAVKERVSVKVEFKMGQGNKIRVTDPDTGVQTVYTRSVVSPSSSGNANRYEVECAVFPRNMDENVVFEILNGNNEPIQFSVPKTVENGTITEYKQVESYSITVNQYLNALQDSISNGAAGDLYDIKSDASEKQKALWDLCNALKNYGAWADFYFTYKSVSDMTAEDYSHRPTGSTPYSNSDWKQPWWTDMSYWKSKHYIDPTNTPDKYLDFEALISSQASTFVPSVKYKIGSTIPADTTETGNRSYSASLFLDDTVKMRVYFSQKPTFVNLNDNPNYTVYTAQGKEGLLQVVDSDSINLTNLNQPLVYRFDGNYSDETTTVRYYDEVHASSLGFIKYIVLDFLSSDNFSYEKKGFANTLRALVTVYVSANAYEHAQ